MFISSTEEQFKQGAREQFVQLHRRSLLSKWSAPATGRPYQLMRLDDISRNARYQSRSAAGIQTVPIDQIQGSEGRSTDFDRAWRPLTTANRERWEGIAVARMNDVTLPAIDLIKIGDVYFVRDGHHRISVAKMQGQLAIEANVTEWHGAEIPVASVNGTTQAIGSTQWVAAVHRAAERQWRIFGNQMGRSKRALLAAMAATADQFKAMRRAGKGNTQEGAAA